MRDYGKSILVKFADIITKLVDRGYEVKLLPHVYSTDEDARLDDRIILRDLHNMLTSEVASNTSIYDGNVSLADITREIISTDLFIGGRMHSCLNAITLGKPTLFYHIVVRHVAW